MLHRLQNPIILLLLATLLLGAPAARSDDRFVVNHGAVSGQGGTPLALSLVLPAGREPPLAGWPAVLLLQGSGPTDRDGNQPPQLRSDLLRRLAENLAQHGIASMRYDKRGMHANSASLPANPAQYAEFFRWENFVADAAAAFRFLAEHPGIDAARVAIAGHGEGGVVALAALENLAAAALEPRAVALLATPGRPLEQGLTEQLERALAMQKASAAQSRAVVSANRQVIDAIRATGAVPGSLPRSLAGLYPSYAGPFLQALLPLDPVPLLRRFGGPVLLVQGETDTQISPHRDLARLEAALAERPGAESRVLRLPGLGHGFGTEAAAEPAPAFIEGVTAWLQERLPAK